MQPGFNPNWLNNHEESLRKREEANREMSLKVHEYKFPERKDFLTPLGDIGVNREELSEREFAPLISFLELNKPDERDQILSYMMYMGYYHDAFHYKNDCTREYIKIDRTGRVVSQEANALFWIEEEKSE